MLLSCVSLNTVKLRKLSHSMTQHAGCRRSYGANQLAGNAVSSDQGHRKTQGCQGVSIGQQDNEWICHVGNSRHQTCQKPSVLRNTFVIVVEFAALTLIGWRPAAQEPCLSQIE